MMLSVEMKCEIIKKLKHGECLTNLAQEYMVLGNQRLLV